MWHEARKQEKRIRGMMVDLRKRAERRREYYERIKQDPAQFLQLHGRQCRIHLDPAVALAADSPTTMMPWQGRSDNIIDRFDVRAHLDIIPEYKVSTDVPRMNDGAEEYQVNYERYRVLVQNEFFGIKEDKFLYQIFMEERFGPVTKPGIEEEKKKLSEKKAAIGYVYEDSTHPPFRKDKFSHNKEHIKPPEEESEEEENEDEEDLSDIDFDVSVDVEQLTIEQSSEMNSYGLKYGMADTDFISFLHQDKDEADQLKMARELEEEKAMYSGRKSRRERRALREKKLQGRRVTSPPSYAAREEVVITSKSYNNPRSISRSKSRSPSPPPSTQITFITSFGGEGSDEDAKSKASLAKSLSGQNSDQDPRTKSAHSDTGHHLPSKGRKASRSSSSSASENVKRKRQSRRHSSYSSTSSRSSSSGSSSSSRRRRRRRRGDQKSSQNNRTRRKHGYSRSNSKSSSGSRSSSSSRSSDSRSRSRSKGPPGGTNNAKRLPTPPIKSYYRHSLSRSGSDLGSLSSEDDEKDNKSDSSQNMLAVRKTAPLFGKAEPSSKPGLTPQERLKRKMQALLNKQYKADKKAALQKQEKQEQERMDRAEELREMAIKLRQRERERRHRQMEYDRDSGDSLEGGDDDISSSGMTNPADHRTSPPSSSFFQPPGSTASSLPHAGSSQPPSTSEERGASPSHRHHQSAPHHRNRRRSKTPPRRSRSPVSRRRSGRRSPQDREERRRRYEDRNYDRDGYEGGGGRNYDEGRHEGRVGYDEGRSSYEGSRGSEGSRNYEGSGSRYEGSKNYDGSRGYGGSRGYEGSRGREGFRGSKDESFRGSRDEGFRGSRGDDGARGHEGSRGEDGVRGHEGSRSSESRGDGDRYANDRSEDRHYSSHRDRQQQHSSSSKRTRSRSRSRNRNSSRNRQPPLVDY